jgi:Raf kinase inhibitor-like YbhB/YbcL family protein
MAVSASASSSASDTVSVRAPEAPQGGASLRVTSTSITQGAPIPMEHVFTHCGGKNTAPQLAWGGAPEGTKSFAITCFDPDAPTGSGYWHWVAFNIPASVTTLAAGEGNSDSPAGGTGGYSDFGMHSYGGPCPPKNDTPHRYTFTVYALDVASVEGASAGTTGATLIFSMRGHVLASSSVMGTFAH